MKKALVLGAGGFIGSHMVKRLKEEGYWVRGVDMKYPRFSKTAANEFVIADLRLPEHIERITTYRGALGNYYHPVPQRYEEPFDEIYQFAADMGGAGYIFTGNNDANVMTNSALINLNVLNHARYGAKIFFASSACIYPAHNQEDPDNPDCSEESAYPAAPDSEYGWEKLFSERLYLAYARNFGYKVAIGRYHNVFGPEGTYEGGKEKAPAALCRKIAQATDSIEIWGDGRQTRSFLYIDEAIEATRLLMKSDFAGPVNIGSDHMISIRDLALLIMEIAGKKPRINFTDGPTGVRGRCSNNRLILEQLGWEPTMALHEGLEKTYWWIEEKLKSDKTVGA